VPKPARKPDALRILARWREAVDAGHKSQAAAAIAELQELATRPARK